MTRKNDKQSPSELKALMLQNTDHLQTLVQWLLQEVLEQEMTEAIGAAKGERTEGRQSYRSRHGCTSKIRARRATNAPGRPGGAVRGRKVAQEENGERRGFHPTAAGRQRSAKGAWGTGPIPEGGWWIV